MPTLEDIYKEFDRIFDDPAYDSTRILPIFNRCIGEISGRVLLPALETIATVTTSTTANLVSLPDGTGTSAAYQRALHYCYSETNNRNIRIYGGISLLYKGIYDPDLNGCVVGVAVSGSNLYYYKRPSSAETLRLHYFAKPEILTIADTPTVFPDHLQEPLLLNYALWKAFSHIEDGVDGGKVNVSYYQQEYALALAELISFVGNEMNQPIPIFDDLYLDVYAGGYC